MNFYTYLQTVKLRAAPLPLDEQLKHAALGMLSEAGELADLYKRQLAYGKDFDPVNLLEECGDWVWYFALEVLTLAERHGWNLERLCRDIDCQTESWCRIGWFGKGDYRMEALYRLAEKASNGSAFFHGDSALETVCHFLNSCGFTFEQCLDANNAKLEKRTGKKFSADAVLNRDTGAERAVLEQHAKHGSNSGAG